MSKAARLLATLALCTLVATPPGASPRKVLAPGDPAPDTRGRDHENVLHVIDFSEAKYTLINFWATWCEPCREELPMLQRAHEKLGPRGLRIFGITHENIADEDLAQFIDEMGLTFTLFRAGPVVKKNWVGVRGSLPNSYLVDSDGIVVRRYVGATPQQIEALEGDLLAVIEGRPLGTMVFPGPEGIATEEDRIRQRKEVEESKKKAGGEGF